MDLQQQLTNMKSQADQNIDKNFVFTLHQVEKYVKLLNTSASPGINNIGAHHILHGCNAGLTVYLSVLFTICLRHSVVPESFTQGYMLPIIKKPGLDPSEPNNYRPIVISVVLSKIIELYAIERCGFTPNDLMFGYVEGRSTEMAITLANDVFSYMNTNGSPVYLCSLDAQAAFDGISHLILFTKTFPHMDHASWRLLLSWYERLSARIKWKGEFTDPIPIKKGTRQGGLSSPLLFNITYAELVTEITSSNAGINIHGYKFNAFIYADDILLASGSTTGLQELITIASRSIAKLGLQFNAAKSLCTTIGKNVFRTEPEWFMSHKRLPITDKLKYLGAIISNDPENHSSDRISAFNKSYFSLLPTGIGRYEMSNDVKQKLFSSVCQPVLSYGIASTNLKPRHIREMDSTQAKAVKRSLQLPVICHTTHLMRAFGLTRIQEIYDNKTLQLTKAFMSDSTHIAHFYMKSFVLSSQPTNLLKRAEAILYMNNKSLINFLYNDNYDNIVSTPCGITDSICYLLSNYSSHNRDILCTMLLPF